MSKRDRFEQIYAENNQLNVDAVQAMRVRDTYDTLKVASSYRYFCEGWEACSEDESLYLEDPPTPMTQEEFEGLPPKMQECFQRLSALTLFGDSNLAPTGFAGLAPKDDTE